MSIRTGICKHCGKKKEEHLDSALATHWDCPIYGHEGNGHFEDSGLSSLHEHAEELFEAVDNYVNMNNSVDPDVLYDAMSGILQKIKERNP